MRTVWGRNRRGDESGQTSLMMVAAVAVLLVIATGHDHQPGSRPGPRGRDTQRRRRFGLGGCQGLPDRGRQLGQVDRHARRSGGPAAPAGLLLHHDGTGRSKPPRGPEQQPTDRLTTRPRLGAHRFTATTQNRQVLESSSRRTEFSATAEARSKSGPVCVLVDGKVGLFLRGSCVRGERIILVIPPAVAPAVHPPAITFSR